MNALEVRERGRLPLTDEQFSVMRGDARFLTLVTSGVMQVRFGRAGYELEAGPYVGAADLGNAAGVTVTEKVPGTLRSLFGLAYATEYKLLSGEAGYAIPEKEGSAAWLQEATWAALLDDASRYVAAGIERHYVTAVRFSSQPRGKVLLKRTVQEALSHGIRGRLYHTNQELSRDTILNRLVKLALTVIAGSNAIGRRTPLAGRAAQLLFHLPDVRPDRRILEIAASGADGRAIGLAPEVRESSLARLALAVVQGVTLLPQTSRDVTLNFATFVSLERLFERAVLQTFIRHAATDPRVAIHQYQVDGHGTYVFGDTGVMEAKPDIIVLVDGRCVLLADAKYKALDGDIHNDVYQLLCHCRAYGAREGWLIGLGDEERIADRYLGQADGTVVIRILAVRPDRLSTDLVPWLAESVGKLH